MYLHSQHKHPAKLSVPVSLQHCHTYRQLNLRITVGKHNQRCGKLACGYYVNPNIMMGPWLVKISDLVPCNCDYVMQTTILPLLKLQSISVLAGQKIWKAVRE
jgi:hypothetical protein